MSASSTYTFTFSGGVTQTNTTSGGVTTSSQLDVHLLSGVVLVVSVFSVVLVVSVEVLSAAAMAELMEEQDVVISF